MVQPREIQEWMAWLEGQKEESQALRYSETAYVQVRWTVRCGPRDRGSRAGGSAHSSRPRDLPVKVTGWGDGGQASKNFERE